MAAPGVLRNDSDLDQDRLTVDAHHGTSTLHANFSIAADGSFVYDPAMTNLSTLPAGAHEPDEFSYTVRDSRGASATGTVHIEVRGVNDPPETYDQTLISPEGASTGTGVARIRARDIDDGDSPEFSVTGGSGAQLFAVHPHTGYVTVVAPWPFDNGATPQHTLEIEVRDSAGLTDTATITIIEESSGPVVGDWGDAPDPSHGMDTGYYTLGAGGIVNAGVDAHFPTDHLGRQGPYAKRTDQFALGGAGSLEIGALDQSDPDGISNLDPPDADLDSDDAPLRILLLLGGTPAKAVVLTGITFEPGAPDAYWNFFVDSSQDGQWSTNGRGDEWAVSNQPVAAAPYQVVSSDVFDWFGHESFGMLGFPAWARSMVTTERAGQGPRNGYHGEGPVHGFSSGEIEDYFLEWVPIGPVLDDDESPVPETLERVAALGAEVLPIFHGPETARVGDYVELELAGAEASQVTVTCLPEGKGVVSGSTTLDLGNESQVCDGEMTVAAAWFEDSLGIYVESAPEGAKVLIAGDVSDEEHLGTEEVDFQGGAAITISQ